MVLKILTIENPTLRLKAKEIKKVSKRLRNLADDMLETMYKAKGAGLAAPQIGISERLVVIDVGDGPLVLVNPKIIHKEGSNKDIEGCLSLPGRNEYITRADKVKVVCQNLDGREVTLEGSGLLARAFQHEIDHLDGIIYIDYLSKEKN